MNLARVRTLAESLEARFAAKNWADYSRVDDPNKSVRSILANKVFDRDGVTMTDSDHDELQRLVDDVTREVGEAYRVRGQSFQSGMTRSARDGRFVATETGPPPASWGPASIEAWQEEQNARHSLVMEQLREAHGLPETEWRFMVSATSQPDGVPRRIVTYFTRFEEPEYFVAHQAYEEAKQRRHARLQAFFDGLARR